MRQANGISLRAYAKINLSLEVLGKRPDGYHSLRSVMQTVNLYDTVHIKAVAKENYLKLVTNLPYLPSDSRNIAYKAARLLIDRFGIREGVFISLEKRIPVSAGLGGGSADCAAVLIGMRNLFNLSVSRWELLKIGKELGADVPFCMTMGTVLAEGIGERLTRLRPMPKSWFLLARLPIVVSTADIFSAYNPDVVEIKHDTQRLLASIRRGDLPGLCASMANSLESVTAGIHPVIKELKELMLINGALGALMSGSGPTVFGVFDDKKRAASAEAAVCERFADADVFIVRPYNNR
ncbi:MAG: 4-(cytidine 5'-diphospho)-2-C-methyl-D-erythritol kinase [Clostridiales bacterium]|jgi:4-diphosphocytidyl-2-C-methyl-D-erythritol kinase|nr:4-(cytidine 5'-diphospho)-2-C-methyl-D-erythritol kinase [Clostridiales bacterium]